MTDTRREFLRRALYGAAALGGRASLGGSAFLAACRSPSATDDDAPDEEVEGERFPLRLPGAVTPRDLTLTAAPGTADFGGGLEGPGWLLNGALPSPLMRLRRGDTFQATLVNQLRQDCILHWHGITPPEAMDGHPRFAVGTGGSYEYQYTMENRAGTYWYHPHTHLHTAEQTYRGTAGLLLVSDEEEDALELPPEEREIPLVVQDRRVDSSGVPYYEPLGPDLMTGYMGSEVFVNGTRRPYLEVDSALYRFRLLNGSNARIFRLARSDGGPIVLIGNDGGFIDMPRSVPWVDLAPAERVDLLLDLSEKAAGERIMLRSLPFSIPGGPGFVGGSDLQGQAVDLLELRVARRVQEQVSIPDGLPAVPAPDPTASVRERTFYFRSEMANHTINDLSFEMERIDERVPFGDTEIWSFVNDSMLPHPVHLHATQFKVLSRTGGRGQVMPWERGIKDTVLIHPLETVRVAVEFTAYRGLFLFHCHNLEHEDIGMMLNILVE